MTPLLQVGTETCDSKDAIDRCGIARAALCAKFGRAHKSLLSLKNGGCLIARSYRENPDNYRITVLDFAQRRTFFPGGNGGKLIPLRHDRGHFEPPWVARGPNNNDRINAKMQIAKFGARKIDLVGGGAGGRCTCACGRKGRKSSASSVRNLCASRDMNYRPSCIFGSRSRLMIGNMGETTCAPCRGKTKE